MSGGDRREKYAMDKMTKVEEEASKDLEINLEDIEPPVPPDGGWAWAVLLGSFLCMFCVDGLSFSFGVLLSDLQTSFECTTSKISLAGSLIVGFTLISGPIVSALSNVLSFRCLVLFGSAVSFFLVLSCAFVYNIDVFIVLFGFVTGVCYGVIYLPAATIVSQWFAKRRATATGISVCGSSVGTAVYSSILPEMLKRYSWRGSLAIMAAMSLHCFAAGCLFIPLRDYQRLHPIKEKVVKTEIEVNDEGDATTTSGGSQSSHRDPKFARLGSPNSVLVGDGEYQKKSDNELEAVSPSTPKPERGDKLCHCVSCLSATVDKGELDCQTHRENSGLVRLPKSEKHQPPVVGLSTVNRVVEEVLSQQNQLHSGSFSRRRTLSVEPSPGASVFVKRDQAGGDVLFASAVSLRPIADAGVHVDSSLRREIMQKLQEEMDLPANRMDFFYSGSMAHVDEYVSSSNVNDYVRSITKIESEEVGEEGAAAHSTNRILKMLGKLFDFDLLRSPTFILLLASSVFCLFGYPVPYMFLADEARTLGHSAEASANLIVYLSSVNTVGRVLAGVISDCSCTDALFVNNAALIISGTACIILPMVSSYVGHVVYAVTFGLAIAAFVCLRIILLVEMLGLKRLTNAFGFLLLFQGVAYVVSPPILAAFYDSLQSYRYTFILGGSSLIVSAVLCFPLRPVLRWERRRRGEVAPPSQSGYCLRTIRYLRDRMAA